MQAAVAPAGRALDLVLHPIPETPPKTGVKAQDLDEKQEVLEPLGVALGDRFQMAWATLVSKARPEGLFASAYHIKVAVRDGRAVWLSSGNWQSSNQPNIKPLGSNPDRVPTGFHRKFNRDYHAIIENAALADIYETYIKRDLAISAAQAGGAQPVAAPDLFVPEEEEIVSFAPPRLFSRCVSIGASSCNPCLRQTIMRSTPSS